MHGQGLLESPHMCVHHCSQKHVHGQACLNRPTREYTTEARDICTAWACLNHATRECITGAWNMGSHMSTPQTHATCLETTPKVNGTVRSHDSHGAESRVR